ncbi:threonine kinase (EC 2.7.1.-) [Streptoalloteichus tenebrarius]|uniref:Threonine kinase n=1 Tax=Streptoalloteichus tenebrarius (strain ATCC 17920 / DSM 40477 / JCM 4838 / CBS 697.72 / NBRC 16177 / NCIMB 11028 / NRRL B-12390 / A12253. 1 / ISP 5477) TaxID=1933 RepID=A0ABT1HQP5_STRSD|nr:hypothetical protein [Streptoalloteichus tenebrarius]MCP2257841.1 threonine kinase (EC 2.7.1.-) [Streptoalloteichus tenebrarius]BFE99797.1 hypothetical protein GCM10020241_14730 [Streptoalloteichus tenebrarius]
MTTIPSVAAVARPKVHSGVCQGTLGELFQGPFPHGGRQEIAIVSLPVDRFSWVYFTEHGAGPDRPDGTGAGAEDLAGAGRTKSQRAVDFFLAHHGLRLPPGRWDFHTELTVGAGMASSTADVVATLRCLFRLFDLAYDQRLVRAALAEIERADSVFLDEFALYLSGRHEVVHHFGDKVGLYTCYTTEGGSVDTEDLGEELLAHYALHSTAYQYCLDELVTAFRAGDVGAIGRCATRSAELGQLVVPKRSFDEVRANQRAFRADGIFVAHTGSIIGYLFRERPDRARMDDLSAFFRELGQQCHFARGGWRDV